MKKIIFVLFFVFIVGALPFFLAEDQVSINSKVVEAQSALNAPGFDAAGAFGISFSDSIDPSTGALTISQTDLSIPGRNSNDVVISRRYSSNIFLNINDGLGDTCSGPAGGNTGENQICPNCLPPSSIPQTTSTEDGIVIPDVEGLATTKCSPGGEAASFTRAKYLGRGWTMNYMENRFKDVTPLIYKGSSDDFTYEFVPVRGINSQSLVADNQQKSLVFPSMFEQYTNALESDFFYWGLDLAYEAVSTTGTYLNTMECANAPDFLCRQYYATRDEDNPSEGTYFYISYTDDLSPVFITNQIIRGENIPKGITQSATYYSKDGKEYIYNHPVYFCSKYDDLPGNAQGYCDALVGWDELANSLNWAENPYAGTYLTSITDNFGNTIRIDYNGDSPFIDEVTASSGRSAIFDYGNDPLDIDSRIESIAFPSYKGDKTIYRVYEYYSGYEDKPLLKETCVSSSESCDSGVYPGTTYKYEYDDTTQELNKVTLPSGAQIEYTYAWTKSIPAIDISRDQNVNYFGTEIKRRVVVERKITNGGYCPGPYGDPVNVCKWFYQYTFDGGKKTMNTIVTDPYGYKTTYLAYPTTTPTLMHQFQG